MNRRENLKLLFTGSLASGFLWTTACNPANKEPEHHPTIGDATGYGRTPEELEYEEMLKYTTFITDVI